MKTTESCRMCEKVVVTIEKAVPFKNLEELPNTYKKHSTAFGWKHYDIMEYALVPRCINGTIGIIDLYTCIEEDELDDVDIMEYTEHFLKTRIYPSMKNIKEAHLFAASLSTPTGIGCCRLQHELFDVNS